MRKTYHKFLIVFTIFMLLGGVSLYFFNGLQTEASLTSSLDTSADGKLSSDQKIASDISFISSLMSLTKINIDTSLFTNKSFQLLNDNTVKIEPGLTGRNNPFAPLDYSSNNLNTSGVQTNDPLEIKSNTVVLSGSVSNTTGASGAYFEYGLTEDLGRKTPEASLSLIGTFIYNITGLNSKTTYFYKACARLSGAVVCGDTMSFETAY